jgi:hypothetical protein
LVPNLVLIGQGVFSRRTLENRPFPLKASIAYTTLPCANALACDKVLIPTHQSRRILNELLEIGLILMPTFYV